MLKAQAAGGGGKTSLPWADTPPTRWVFPVRRGRVPHLGLPQGGEGQAGEGGPKKN